MHRAQIVHIRAAQRHPRLPNVPDAGQLLEGQLAAFVQLRKVLAIALDHLRKEAGALRGEATKGVPRLFEMPAQILEVRVAQFLERRPELKLLLSAWRQSFQMLDYIELYRLLSLFFLSLKPEHQIDVNVGQFIGQILQSGHVLMLQHLVQLIVPVQFERVQILIAFRLQPGDDVAHTAHFLLPQRRLAYQVDVHQVHDLILDF